MKKIIKIIRWVVLVPLKLIHKLVTFILDICSTIILGLGTLIYGLSFFIKSPKDSIIILRTVIKKIFNDEFK